MDKNYYSNRSTRAIAKCVYGVEELHDHIKHTDAATFGLAEIRDYLRERDYINDREIVAADWDVIANIVEEERQHHQA